MRCPVLPRSPRGGNVVDHVAGVARANRPARLEDKALDEPICRSDA